MSRPGAATGIASLQANPRLIADRSPPLLVLWSGWAAGLSRQSRAIEPAGPWRQLLQPGAAAHLPTTRVCPSCLPLACCSCRDLIKQVRQCKTAAEERDVVAKESAALRQAFKEQDGTYRHRCVWSSGDGCCWGWPVYGAGVWRCKGAEKVHVSISCCRCAACHFSLHSTCPPLNRWAPALHQPRAATWRS